MDSEEVFVTISFSTSALPSFLALLGGGRGGSGTGCCLGGTGEVVTMVLLEAGKLLQIGEVWTCDVIVTLGGEEIVTFGLQGLHNGEIAFASVVRG